MDPSLRRFFLSFGPLSEDDLAVVASKVRSRSLDKGQFLLRPGDVAGSVYFVKAGLLRLYHVVRGREQTRNFFTEKTLFSDSLSYFTKRPTTSYLEALEPTDLLELSKSACDQIFDASLPLARVGRRIIEAATAALAARVADSLVPKGPARYQALLASRPDLFQRVPQYLIASYLGLTPEALSRIISRTP